MSTSEQRSGDQVAGARLSKVEQENLWQLFKPTALDLLRVAAGHSASRPIEEGEDAVQEVFLSFAQQAVRGRLDCLDNRKLSEISPAELSQHVPGCRRYLLCALVRHCHQAHRRNNRAPRIQLSQIGDFGDCREREPKAPCGANSERRASYVGVAVSRLPDDLREVVTLRFYTHLSEAETAKALDIPVGTVKSRIHRSKERLRALLRPMLVEDEA